MKKILLCLFIIVLGVVGILFIYRTYMSHDSGETDQWPEVTYLEEDVDFRAYILGDEIIWPDGFHYSTIDRIRDIKKINLDHDHIYLILSDTASNLHLSQKDLDYLIAFTETHTNFNFIYLGSDSLGYFNDKLDAQLKDNAYSLGYVIDEGSRLIVCGTLNKEDLSLVEKNEYLIADAVLSSIVSSVKTNE